ncbi:MAG: radical SAM protein [Candidatus Altiarchaeota archaeon]
MKVLLLNPPAPGGQSRDGRCQTEGAAWVSAFPPTTFAGIAGCVREKFGSGSLMVLDCIGADIGYAEALKRSVGYRPDYIVLNTSTPTIDSDLRIVGEVRKVTGAKVIAYGENVTARYRHLLEEGSVDYAILAEPETPIIKILEGSPRSPGVAMLDWDGGKWMEPDMDSLPFPAYDLLPLYYYPLTGERWMFVRTGRGCPYKCIYCIEPLNSPTPRFHSVDYLIRQFKWLTEDLNIRLFMFWDEIATFDKGHMLELCRRIKSDGLKFKWFCTTRVNHFDEELAKEMSEAGCRMMSFGFESGNQEILDRNGKGITLEQSKAAVKAAKKYGIWTIGHFIIGLPGETPKTARKTAKFARDLKINFAQFYVATPFPGSVFHRMAKENGWLLGDDMERIQQGVATISYPNFTARQMQEERRNAYLRFYLRPYSVYSNIFGRSPSVLLKLPLQALNFSRWVLK